MVSNPLSPLLLQVDPDLEEEIRSRKAAAKEMAVEWDAGF